MSRHVRPASPIPLARLRLAASARVNGGVTHEQGTAQTPLPLLRLQGSALAHTLVGNKTATGQLRFGKLTVGNGAAIARRRSISQGVSPIPLRGTAIAGTGLRIDADAAVVQLYNAQGNPSGFGPSDDPEGVFYGRADLSGGDVWWPSNVPANCTVAPLPGGSFTLTVGAGVTPGSYSFTWNLRLNAGGVRSSGSKAFTVT